jgi:hypothetical protein
MTTECPEEPYCTCSDDEKYNPGNNPDPTIWEPSRQDMVRLYERIANGDTLDFEWKSPGRRDPSPEDVKPEKMEIEETETVKFDQEE